jgi:aryl-alcohol dehydrogenase-like predicted oxidoreductase
LHIDRLSVLHLHAPRIADLQPPLVETLYALKSEGIVEFVGINSFNDEVVRHALTMPVFDSFMVEFNIIRKVSQVSVLAIRSAGFLRRRRTEIGLRRNAAGSRADGFVS